MPNPAGPLQPPIAGAVLAARAEHLIVRACRDVLFPVALVPAYFPWHLVRAIQQTGVEVRYYDVHPDLTPPTEPLIEAIRPDVGTVVWHHPFGLHHPGPPVTGMLLIDDACVAMRSFLSHGVDPGDRQLVVFSPRKEFGWPEGGAAVGRAAATLRGCGPPAPDTEARWCSLDLEAELARGRAATRHARSVLGDRLPGMAEHDVLRWLPMLSDRRDELVSYLRYRGLRAWEWQLPLPGLDDARAPGAAELRRRLFLVSVPEPGSPQFTVLEALRTDPWRARPPTA